MINIPRVPVSSGVHPTSNVPGYSESSEPSDAFNGFPPLLLLAVGASPWRRRIGWIVAVVVVIALLAILLRPQPQPVDVVTVERGPLTVELAEEGETRVRDRYVVSAPLAGRVLRIDLEPGDPVVAGSTVLATFSPQAPGLLDSRSRAEAQGRLAAAVARLGGARAGLAQAQEDFNFQQIEAQRFERLAAEGVVSEEEFDRARRLLAIQREGVEAARFQVEATQHEREVAQAALVRTDTQSSGASRDEPILLTSPVDGVVLQRRRESEAVVPAGEPLLEVGDPAALEIIADYLSTDAVRIEPGQRAYLDHWGGDEPLAARVRRVEPSGFLKISALGVEEQRVNVLFDIESSRQQWGSLGDGFRVEVRTIVWSDDDVLQVPLGSLLRHQGRWAVFRVVDGVARLTPAEVGHRGETHAEILSGLEAGQELLLHPGDTVVDGASVADRGEATR